MASIRPQYQTDYEDEPVGLETQLSSTGKTVLWMALLAALAVAVNAPTLVGGWLEQDAARVTNYTALRAWQGLWPIWRLPHQAPDFSPLSSTMQLFEARAWGLSGPRAAIGYRAVNLLLHIAAVVLLYHLLTRLELPGAWAGAGIFAIHPVNVVSVSWIAQRPALLGTACGLATLIVLLRLTGLNPAPAEPRAGPALPANRAILLLLALVLIALTFAAAPAIAALIGPAALVLAWWERGKIARRDWAFAGPLLGATALVIAGAVYVAARRGTLAEEFSLHGVSAAARPLAVLEQIGFYALAVVAPVRLQFAYQAFEWNDPWMIALAAAVVLALVISLAVRRKYGRGPVAAIALFSLMLLPATIHLQQAERLYGGWVGIQRLYPASAVLIVAIVAMVADFFYQRGWNFRSAVPVSAIAAGVAVVCVGMLGIERSLAYQSQPMLWRDVQSKDPTNVIALVNLGDAAMAEKPPDFSQAERWFHIANQLRPRDPLPLIKLGGLYERRSVEDPAMRDRARTQFIAALALEPDNFDATFGLARVLSAKGDSAGSLRMYEKAAALRPRDPLVYNNIGLVHFERGELEQSEKSYRKALDLDPRCTPARINLANLYYKLGKVDAAAAELTTAVEIDRDSYEAFMNAGAMLGQMGHYDKSARLLRQAVLLRNDAPEAYLNLGMALLGWLTTSDNDPTKSLVPTQKIRMIGEVVFNFERAVELTPPTDPRRLQYQQHLDQARAMQRQMSGN